MAPEMLMMLIIMMMLMMRMMMLITMRCRGKGSRAKQSEGKQRRAEESKAKQRKAKQSNAQERKAEHRKAKQSKAKERMIVMMVMMRTQTLVYTTHTSEVRTRRGCPTLCCVGLAPFTPSRAILDAGAGAQVVQRCRTGSATLYSSSESMQKQRLQCSIWLAAVQAQRPQELQGQKEQYAL